MERNKRQPRTDAVGKGTNTMSATKRTTIITEDEETPYFGGCPYCHKTDGYINVGREHWFVCDQHQTKWRIGENLFSSWREETLAQQEAEQDAMGFEDRKSTRLNSSHPSI